MKLAQDKLDKIINDPVFKTLVADTLSEIDFDSFPAPGYSIPMLINCVKDYSNLTVDNIPRYSSADHITTYKIFSLLLQTIVQKNDMTDFTPYFESSLTHDKNILSAFVSFLDVYVQINTVVSLENKIWSMEFENDEFLLSINPHARRNALDVFENKANFHLTPPNVTAHLKDNKKTDLVRLSLDSGTIELDLLTSGVKKSWLQLEKSLGFNTADFTTFKGFVSYLHREGYIWFMHDSPVTRMKAFIDEYKLPQIPNDKIVALIDFFSIIPQQANDWMSPCPFFKIGKFYAFWPFCFHVYHPDLLFLNLIHRKKQNEWNNTMGANMSQVGTYLSGKIKSTPHLLVSAEKKKGGMGDIDLGLYDTVNDHLLLCEVKTVFDKFRTNYQASNYKEMKVNLNRAAIQLNSLENHITSGKWKLSEIFSYKKDIIPSKISKIILTWWDFLKFDEKTAPGILNMNFKSFLYLLSLAEDNLDHFINTVSNLQHTYCAYTIKTTSFFHKGEEVKTNRQVQTDVLPPLNMIPAFKTDQLFQKAVHQLPHFPDDWEKEAKEKDLNYYFY